MKTLSFDPERYKLVYLKTTPSVSALAGLHEVPQADIARVYDLMVAATPDSLEGVLEHMPRRAADLEIIALKGKVFELQNLLLDLQNDAQRLRVATDEIPK
jgi:hypothetical protein